MTVSGLYAFLAKLSAAWFLMTLTVLGSIVFMVAFGFLLLTFPVATAGITVPLCLLAAVWGIYMRFHNEEPRQPLA